MDSLFELIILLFLQWRIGVSVVLASVVAVLLCLCIPAVPGFYGLLVVIVGFGAGLLWDASSERGNGKVDG